MEPKKEKVWVLMVGTNLLLSSVIRRCSENENMNLQKQTRIFSQLQDLDALGYRVLRDRAGKVVICLPRGTKLIVFLAPACYF